MAFSKKNKRNITVDGKKYFWSVKGNDDWISLSVMTDVQGSSRLSCSFGYHQIPIKMNNGDFHFTVLTNQFVITTYTVRQVIEYALSHNWKPFEKGKDLCLGKLDDKIDLRLEINRADNFKK